MEIWQDWKLQQKSISEIFKENKVYLQLDADIDGVNGTVCFSKEEMSLSRLKKDYFQQLTTDAYNDRFGLCVWSTLYDKDSVIINQGQEKLRIATCIMKYETTMHIFLVSGLEQVICHPDWKVNTLIVHYKLPGDKDFRLKVMNNNQSLKSRYLFAFMISTTHEYFSIAREGVSSVIEPGTEAYKTIMGI